MSQLHRFRPYTLSRQALLNTFKSVSGLDPRGFYPELEELKDFIGLFRNIVRPDIQEVSQQKNYLEAPWPQPSPYLPDQLAATVLKVPPKEIQEFVDHIVSRYISTLRFDWLKASVHVFEHPSIELMNDKELCQVFTQTMYGRFLNPQLDPIDKKVFAEDLQSGSETYFKTDFSTMSRVKPIAGVYCYPCVGLFEGSKKELKLKAIKINNEVLRAGSAQKGRWELAKLYLLNGAAMTALLTVHPRVHFPMDAIAAVSQTVLQEDHLLYQLLKPHLYLQLPLDFAVLYVNKSLLRNNPHEIYTAFPFNLEGALEMIRAGYEGIAGNSSYPKFEFPLQPLEIHSEYGEFLKSYDQVVEKFVSGIISGIPSQDPQVKRWAKHISTFVPGFPDEKSIFEGDNLLRSVTSFIMDVSVIHSADHYSLASVPIHKMPLRIRKAWPKSVKFFDLDVTQISKKQDIFRTFMAHRMYFAPSTIRSLNSVEYAFPKVYQSQVAQFKQELAQNDQSMKIRRYIPLNEIACSIQY